MSQSSHPWSFSLAALAAISLLAVGCDSADDDLEVGAQEVLNTHEVAVPAGEVAAADEAEAAAQGKAAAKDYIAFSRTVEEHMGEANRCYKAALAGDRSLEGRVVLAFTLDAEGGVEAVLSEENTIGPAVTECLIAAARDWSFPAPQVGPLALRYPFVFTLAPEQGESSADTPAVEVAEVSVTSGSGDAGLDKDIIRRIVRAHIDEVRFCYNEGLRRDPALEGRIVAEFKVSGEGRVAAAPKIGTSIGDAEVDSCVADAIQGWRFPKTRAGEEVLVTYPFILKPG